MNQKELRVLSDWLGRRSGLVLAHQPPDFTERRLGVVVRRFGFASLSALIGELDHAGPALCAAVVEAMTVNDSAFFRDKVVFTALRDVILPGLVARRPVRRLKIWSAACACGQEAYSVAMLLADLGLREAGWIVDLMASDLCSDAVAQARIAIYDEAELASVPPRYRDAYFRPTGDGRWRVCDGVRDMVTFRRINLLDAFEAWGAIDVIMCRNVLMYFDMAVRMQMLQRFAAILAADGTLITGTNEAVPQSSGLTRARVRAPGIYSR